MANEDQKAEFAVGLKDEMTEAAESAASALVKLKGEIDSDVRALKGMQQAMATLKTSGVTSGEEFDKLKVRSEALKKSVSDNTQTFLRTGGSFERTAKSGRSFADRVKQLTNDSKNLSGVVDKTAKSSRGLDDKFTQLTKHTALMPGPLGNVIGKLERFRSLTSGGGMSGGIMLVVAALAALVAASVAAIAALYRYGVAQANARRTELLRLEGLTKLRFWYQRIPGNAKEMQKSIDSVSASSVLGRDEIAKLNNELYRMGLRGENLKQALTGAEMKMSVQGEAAARRWIGYAATVQMAGGAVKKMTDRVKADIGGIHMRMLMDAEVQSKKLKESYDALFNGLNIESYLGAWKDINDLVSQSTESGQALKAVIETLIQPLIDDVGAGTPILKRFFQGIILGLLDVSDAVLDLRIWWRQTFGGGVGPGWAEQKNALIVGRTLVVALGMAFMFLAGWVIAATWPILLGVFALYAFINTMRLLVELWEEIDFSLLGKYIVEGLVDGIKSMWNAADKAMSELATRIKTKLKDVLGIKSPSRVFAELGIEIPRGVTAGIVRGQPEVESAVGMMVRPRIELPELTEQAPPRVQPAQAPEAQSSAPAAAAAMGRGATTITLGDININARSDRPEEMAADFRRELERVLESVALQLGARMSGAT